ncbi:MAG: capsid protein, partial [Coprobacillaceae bacterium]
ENEFKEILKNSLSEVLFIGDGAIKISFDKSVSDYPILEFYSGDQIDFVYKRGRFQETIFKNEHTYKGKKYMHYERYGFGYIKNELKELPSNRVVELHSIPETAGLADFFYGGYSEDSEGNMLTRGAFNMSIPIMLSKSVKYKNRGSSIFDGKISDFDALDEVVSQWMDAIRNGRANRYIPEDLIPRTKEQGELIKPNPFDNNFIKVKGTMSENEDNKIQVTQPTIPSENYLESYVTYLDLCLQGLISPSTLGIDTKKLDNAEAQREKEKTTLHMRGNIVSMLEKVIPRIAQSSIWATKAYEGKSINPKLTVTVDFGEYANPSFEAVVETVSKARPGSPIMSVEESVEAMYGDSKDDDEKAIEVKRLKEEQGLLEVEEPTVTSFDGENDDILEVDNVINEPQEE